MLGSKFLQSEISNLLLKMNVPNNCGNLNTGYFIIMGNDQFLTCDNSTTAMFFRGLFDTEKCAEVVTKEMIRGLEPASTDSAQEKGW